MEAFYFFGGLFIAFLVGIALFVFGGLSLIKQFKNKLF